MSMRGQGRVVRRLGAGLAAVAALALAGPATAQEARGLSFVGGLSYQGGGPGQTLLTALVDNGLGERQDCQDTLCHTSEDYPFHFQEGIGLSVTLGFRYRFDAPVSIDVLVSNGQRGHAEGYRGQPNQAHLIITYSSYLVASTVGVHLGPIRVGVGPASLISFWNAVENAATGEYTTTGSVGGGAEVSYSVQVPSAMLALRARGFSFRSARIPNPLDLPIQASQRLFEVGITVNPRTD